MRTRLEKVLIPIEIGLIVAVLLAFAGYVNKPTNDRQDRELQELRALWLNKAAAFDAAPESLRQPEVRVVKGIVR